MPNRSRAFRRYHTWRVATNRERRNRRLHPDPVWQEWSRPAARLRNADLNLGCNNTKCWCCHWDKLMPAPRGHRHRLAVDRDLEASGEVAFYGQNPGRWTEHTHRR